MKTINLIIVIFLFAFVANATTITLLHVNDTHSHMLSTGEKDHQLEGKSGGIARAATVIKQLRVTEPNVLLLHAGDLFQGDPMFNTYFGVPELQLMHQLGFDAMAVGNHEFDLGPGVLNTALSMAFAGGGFPVLSANLDMSAFPSLQTWVQPSIIKNIGGVNIGIFGMTVPDNPTNIPAPVIINSNLATIAQQTVNSLRSNGAQVVICLSHLGINYDKLMIQGTTGIDLVIGGHDHFVFDAPVTVLDAGNHSVPIFQAGAHYRYLGEVHIDFTNNHFSLIDSRIISLDHNIDPDPQIDAAVQQLKAGVVSQFGNIYTNVLSTSNDDIEKSYDEHHSFRDTPLGNLITDAFVDKTGTQIAITPLGLISEDLYKGKITANDVFRAVSYGFDPATGKGFQMATFNITGLEIIKSLEFGLSQIGYGTDFFLQYSGLKFEYDAQQPVGSRVILSSVKINNQPIGFATQYTVTVNSGVAMLLGLAGVNVSNLTFLSNFEYDVVKDYIDLKKKTKYKSEGRIKERITHNHRMAEPVVNPTASTELEVYPNPFNSKLNFVIDKNTNSKANVKLYDLSGKLVSNYDFVNDNLEINTEELKPGIYFYRISTNEKVITGKVICIN